MLAGVIEIQDMNLFFDKDLDIFFSCKHSCYASYPIVMRVMLKLEQLRL